MDGLGTLLIIAGAWFLYSATKNAKPIPLFLAIVRNPSQASSILSNTGNGTMVINLPTPQGSTPDESVNAHGPSGLNLPPGYSTSIPGRDSFGSESPLGTVDIPTPNTPVTTTPPITAYQPTPLGTHKPI